MRELSLFTGAGGGLLASHLLGFQVVGAVEASSYRRQVLRARQEDGLLEDFPIFEDVCGFDGEPWRGRVDIVTGGFPCQPFSLPGKNLGEHDERNLWPETIRIIRDVEPGLVFLENSAALTAHGYFGRILGDLAEGGFDAVWDCIPAAAVGAPHQRDRLWMLAWRRSADPDALNVAARLRDLEDGAGQVWPADPEECFQAYRRVRVESESGGAGVADVVADRMDRVAAVGDGQVPLVAAHAFCRLAEVALEMMIEQEEAA